MDQLTKDYKSLVRNGWRFFYLSHKAWTKAIEEQGLSTSTYPIMEIAVLNPGITQQEIAGQLSIDKSCASRACKFLEANGFIYKEKSTEYAHGFRCFPTEKAKEVCSKIIELEGRHIHALFENSDAHQIGSANAVLSDLIEKLSGQI